jgi:hypothetical protein
MATWLKSPIANKRDQCVKVCDKVRLYLGLVARPIITKKITAVYQVNIRKAWKKLA